MYMNKYHGLITQTGSIDLTPQQKISLSRFHGKKCLIEIPKSTRSLSQNNLYWHYLSVIEAETGNTAEELHEYFRRTLLPAKFITIEIDGKNKEIKIPRSTTELSKIEFGEYLDKICAETNVPIPNPVEAGYIPS